MTTTVKSVNRTYLLAPSIAELATGAPQALTTTAIFLNNCIAASNYWLFFKLINWTFWFCLTFIILTVFVIIDILNEEKEQLSNIQEYFPEKNIQIICINLAILCFLNTCALIFLLYYIVYHLFLQSKGLTTYEYLKLREL